MVPKGDGLGRLKMGKARHDGVGAGLGLGQEAFAQAQQLPVQRIDGIAEPEANVRGDLIVSRPARVQLFPRGADAVREPGLDVHVHVFELDGPGEGAVLDGAGDVI